MKTCIRFCAVIFLTLVSHKFLAAQTNNQVITARAIDPYQLSISETKTTNIIFPYEIISVDKGSSEVLAQKAKGVNNILQLKAANGYIASTNVTVITNDGQFYSFLITYAPEPTNLNIQVTKDSLTSSQHVLLSGPGLNQSALHRVSKQVVLNKRFLHVATGDQKMKFQLNGIYLKENLMWFSTVLKNASLIDYGPISLRFFVRDLRRLKRTARQVRELEPLYMNQDSAVLGKSAGRFTTGFKPFAIPKTQELVIQVTEENGGRTLELHCSHKLLLKTRKL